MLLLILLSLLSTSSCQNIEDVLDDEIPGSDIYERGAFLMSASNETNEGNFQTETELDLEFTSSTIQDVAEEDKEDEVFEDLKATDNTCGNPPVIDHAHINAGSTASYEVGTELKYSCEFGYSTDGANYISRCVSENDKLIWTDPKIICIPRSCGDPGFVLNAQRIGSRFTFPNSVSFVCDDGYELKGLGNIRYCQVNGKWSGSLPLCEKIYCGQPHHPENGRVTYTSLEYGSQLKYDCEKGYLMKNYQTRICTENGTWSGHEPMCLDAHCDQPLAPEYGAVELLSGNSRVGSIAIFKCDNGRILVGSATSKCLDMGEWTFPPPKCVEPCIVPNVEHGIIGKYEKKRWSLQKTFTQLSKGTILKDGEELFLRCDNQYEPFGKNKQEEKVACEKGVWKEAPTCVPAKCRSAPPSVHNTKGIKINRNHGDYVVYYCADHFKKKPGNVTCHFGTWRGVPPTCSDTRCYVDRIQFPGIVKKGNKNVFRSGKEFIFECEKGYEVIGSKNKLKCERGIWKGQLPPCKAESCLTSPPLIENGRVKPYSQLHSSLVSYECDDHYFLQPSSKNVQCLFGEWKGTPPFCREGRCYFQNLKYKSGMATPFKDPTNNGEAIEISCASGYSFQSIKPTCSKGQWTEFDTSPCRPNNCQIEPISNGLFLQRFTRQVWNWKKGYIPETYFSEVKMWSTRTSGEELFVQCHYSYTFQGGSENTVAVHCSEGRWKPTPVCLPRGTYYEEKNETPVAFNLTARTSNQLKPLTTLPDSIKSSAEAIDIKECHCLYQGSNDLVAYSGHKLLESGSRVNANASVKFYCRHFGYHRFMGQREIICKSCKPWHSSEYPICVAPVRSDVIIEIDENLTILPGGILTMDQGTNTQLSCRSVGITEYPKWESTVAINQSDKYINRDQSNRQDYYNVLSIRNASLRHSGKYRCYVPGKRVRDIEICIKPKCKKFDESGELNIYYDKGQEINSSAVFTCRDSSRKLTGPNVLTCLLNGEWSGPPSTCELKACPKLSDTNSMFITYSQELSIGSTATFHCFAPAKLNGASFIKCLPNGKWSNNAPSCTVPRCLLEKLFDHIPENVVPLIEDVISETFPLGFELPLTCEGDLRLTEAVVAKCESNGTWDVPKVTCIPGCDPIQVPPSSNLIVDPKRDFYRFGEFVSLSCHQGQVLSAEVEIVMCLRNGWSETTMPTCLHPQ